MKKIIYLSLIGIFTVLHGMDDSELQRTFDEISKNIAEARAASQAVRDTCKKIIDNCDQVRSSISKIDDVILKLT